MKPSALTISPPLLKALRGDSPRERILHRLHSVALVMRGYSASEAARAYGDSPRAVAYWVKRFSKTGMDGLNEGKRSGRPAKLAASQMRRLRAFVERATIQSNPLNGVALSAYIRKEFGIRLTIRQCWRLLKKLGK